MNDEGWGREIKFGNCKELNGTKMRRLSGRFSTYVQVTVGDMTHSSNERKEKMAWRYSTVIVVVVS